MESNPSEPIYVWKEKDVFELINARSKLNYLFTGKRGSSQNGWEIVATNLRFGVSPYQCKKKWENLQIKYKKIIQPSTGKGLEEQPHGAHDWPFFNKMNEYMSSRHTINPLLLIQSFSPTQPASSSTAPQTSVRSVCSSTTVRISSEDLLSSEAATLTRPPSTYVPSSLSFPSLDSLQLAPSYCPGRSSSCSPRSIPSSSPGPSSGSPRPTPSYSPGPSSGSPRPTPSYSPRLSSGSPRQTPSYSPGLSSGSPQQTPSYSSYPSPSHLLRFSSQQSSSSPPKPSSCSGPIPHLSPILQDVDAQLGHNLTASARGSMTN